MSLADDLLAAAEYLARRNSKKPTPADRRRSISTAYYALFHRLIDAVVARGVPTPEQQAVVARTFEHGGMRQLCKRVQELAARPKQPDPKDPLYLIARLIGWPVPGELVRLAGAFAELQERRHAADYDRAFEAAPDVTREALKQAREAFADLAAVEPTPAGRAFLLLPLLGEPKAR